MKEPPPAHHPPQSPPHEEANPKVVKRGEGDCRLFFSTELANRAAEAVCQGHVDSILTFHRQEKTAHSKLVQPQNAQELSTAVPLFVQSQSAPANQASSPHLHNAPLTPIEAPLPSSSSHSSSPSPSISPRPSMPINPEGLSQEQLQHRELSLQKLRHIHRMLFPQQGERPREADKEGDREGEKRRTTASLNPPGLVVPQALTTLTAQSVPSAPSNPGLDPTLQIRQQELLQPICASTTQQNWGHRPPRRQFEDPLQAMQLQARVLNFTEMPTPSGHLNADQLAWLHLQREFYEEKRRRQKHGSRLHMQQNRPPPPPYRLLDPGDASFVTGPDLNLELRAQGPNIAMGCRMRSEMGQDCTMEQQLATASVLGMPPSQTCNYQQLQYLNLQQQQQQRQNFSPKFFTNGGLFISPVRSMLAEEFLRSSPRPYACQPARFAEPSGIVFPECHEAALEQPVMLGVGRHGEAGPRPEALVRAAGRRILTLQLPGSPGVSGGAGGHGSPIIHTPSGVGLIPGPSIRSPALLPHSPSLLHSPISGSHPAWGGSPHPSPGPMPTPIRSPGPSRESHQLMNLAPNCFQQLLKTTESGNMVTCSVGREPQEDELSPLTPASLQHPLSLMSRMSQFALPSGAPLFHDAIKTIASSEEEGAGMDGREGASPTVVASQLSPPIPIIRTGASGLPEFDLTLIMPAERPSQTLQYFPTGSSLPSPQAPQHPGHFASSTYSCHPFPASAPNAASFPPVGNPPPLRQEHSRQRRASPGLSRMAAPRDAG
uniref:B-cell CLL/lymphoma 9 protein-like isoform X1 n=1 Tax=Myxine glutinosa TaxID=7769 RepID=UPI00358EDC1C